jgi:hypothetical protein
MRMSRNRIVLLILFGMCLLFMVSPTLAQQRSIEDVRFEDIIDALGPRDGQALLFDIMLYTIFILGLVNSVLIPDKQLFVSILNYTVLGVALASKLLIDAANDGGAVYPSAILEPGDFAVLPMNVILFVFPLIMAGMLRSVKGKRSNALFPCLIMGLIGGAYFFIFWATEQRPLSDVPTPEDATASLFFAALSVGAWSFWQRFKR